MRFSGRCSWLSRQSNTEGPQFKPGFDQPEWLVQSLESVVSFFLFLLSPPSCFLHCFCSYRPHDPATTTSLGYTTRSPLSEAHRYSPWQPLRQRTIPDINHHSFPRHTSRAFLCEPSISCSLPRHGPQSLWPIPTVWLWVNNVPPRAFIFAYACAWRRATRYTAPGPFVPLGWWMMFREIKFSVKTRLPFL
jgi:hypothetical protein